MSSSPWLTDELSSKIKESESYYEYAQDISQDLIHDKLNITTFVERLSGVLTDTNPESRTKGMLLFSKVLSHLPNDFLTQSQMVFISTFFVDRLKDNHRVIPPVLEGLLVIIKMQHLPSDIPCKIVRGINEHVPCQQQVRTDRTVIYNIFQQLLLNYTQEIKSMGADLVYAFISAMDGERDPRNLMFLFTFLPDFLKTIPLAHLTEEVFDVIACYYPVDFNPSEDDPNAITRNELAEKLCFCLCAVPEFAEFTLPLMLDKLNSDLKLAQLDSLKLLKQSCSTFKIESYETHLPTIWSYLQKPLLNKSDSEISQTANDCLSVFVKHYCLNNDATKSGEFLKEITNSMKILLAEAKTKAILQQPLQIILSVAKASTVSCKYMAENVVPLMLLHHHLNLGKQLQVVSLQWFLSMFNICKTWSIHSQVKQVFIELPKMCFSGLTDDNDDLKVSCFKVISGFADIIDVNDIEMLCDIVDQQLTKDCSEQVDKTRKECLLRIAEMNQDCFNNYVADKMKFEDVSLSEILVVKYLDILTSFVCINNFTNIIMKKIVEVLDGSNTEICVSVIVALSNNFSDKNLFKDETLKEIEKNHNIIKHILNCADRNIDKLNESLDLISKLTIIIFKTLVVEEQYELLVTYIPKYLDKVINNELFIVLMESLLNSTRQEIQTIPNLDQIVSKSTDLAFNGQQPIVRHKSNLILSNLFNKYIHSKDEISRLYTTFRQELIERTNLECEEKITKDSTILCAWICKSFLLNGHIDAVFWLQTLINLLYIEKWSLDVAKLFKLISNDTPDALNPSCFCKYNSFYQQKLFHSFTKISVELQKTLPKDHNKESHLLAYACIIQAVPKAVLQIEASKISSVLIESLSFSDEDLLIANLSTLSYFIENKNPALFGSLQSLVPRCLKLASFKKSMLVRIASLECLYNVAHYCNTILTLPYKEDIIYDLASVLDDPKRLVRCAAVKARTRWYLVGAPGEEKIQSS